MGQVPKNYCIIGSGRLASHLSNYFTLMNIPFYSWSRSGEPKFNSLDPQDFMTPRDQLEATSLKTSKILLCISDSSIQDFIQSHFFLKNKTLIHFSGALHFKDIYCAHPLMSFTEDLYERDQYEQLPFITETETEAFDVIFPELNNPHWQLNPEKKALYHALCVASGNFTTILWNSAISTFDKELNLPKEVLWPYLDQVTKNIKRDHKRALTGPFTRNDTLTIQSHLNALDKKPLKKLYQSFLDFYKIKSQKKTQTTKAENEYHRLSN